MKGPARIKASAGPHCQELTAGAYRSLPTVSLLQCIAEYCDKEALNELLSHRSLFRLGEKRLLLSDFLWMLRDRDIEGYPVEIVNCTYDRALQRFASLPEAEPSHERSGPNCTRQYRAALRHIGVWRNDNPEAGKLEEEAEISRILRGLVAKHYYLCKRDCLRESPSGYRRYAWRVKGGEILLRCPHYLSGRKLRTWLEARFDDVDPGCTGEAERIQREIDLRFPRGSPVSVDVKGAQDRIAADDPSPWIELLHREAAERVESLAIMLANEKAEHVQDQRRAIRKLGEEGVRRLVVRILGSLALGDYRAKEVAKAFGLSQATLSRFAGTRWGQGLGGPDSVQVPDLWRNLAHLLAREPEFLAAAAEVRVLRRLRQTLALIGGQLLEDEHGN